MQFDSPIINGWASLDQVEVDKMQVDLCSDLKVTKPLFYLLLVICASICVACGPAPNLDAIQATYEAETTLTGKYGAEVRGAIENFEKKWFSREEQLDPGIQSEIATGNFLRTFGHTEDKAKPFGEPFGLVTQSAVVVGVRVLDYSLERFKAIASVIKQTDEVTPEGEFKKARPYRKFCGVYVFLREDNLWKLAAFFDITDLDHLDRDWSLAPPDLKETIGDLPSSDCNYISVR